VDLAKPVERCIHSMYWHADAVDEIARVVERGTVDGRPVDLAWLVVATGALQTTAALLSVDRLTERAWGEEAAGEDAMTRPAHERWR
jgi:hypothetical protein